MKKAIVLSVLVLLTAVFLSGCMGETEDFIQGTWLFEDPHLSNITAESHLTQVWFFSNGIFTYQVCCFNIDQEIRGRYRLLSVEEDAINLEFFNLTGTSANIIHDIRIEIDREHDQISIQGAGPYTRLGTIQ